jgi:hypothetical protein
MLQTVPVGVGSCIPIVPLVGCQVTSISGDVARSAAGAAAGGLVSAFTGYLSSSNSWLVGHIAGLFDASPDLSAGWFRGAYRVMERAFEAVVTPILLVATIGSILRQDLRRLGRIWAVGLPVAALAAACGTVFTDLAMKGSDALTAMVVGTHLDPRGALLNLANGSFATGSPALVTIGIYCVAMAGALMIWLELVLRSAAIYIAVFFMPLGLVTYVWPATAPIAKRSVGVVAALVLSKFVIFCTLWLGMASAGGGTSIDGALEGAGILLLASFAPFALLKLVPLVEGHAIAHLDGLSRRPFRAASRAGAAVAAPSHPVVHRILAARGSTETSRPASSPVAPQPIPVREPDFRVTAGGSDG